MNEEFGRFERLPEQECWRLLREGAIGRVAWQAPNGPEVLPVTYAVHDGLIVFRTSPYGPLAELRNPHPVAFEIDELNVEGRSGWSVTARGTSRATRADELVALWGGEDPVPWAGGSRVLFIVIAPDVVSGRSAAAPTEAGEPWSSGPTAPESQEGEVGP